MKSWLDCFEILAELLVDSLITLRDNFVGIVDEAAADAGHPCPHTATALAPPNHALAVAGDFFCGNVRDGEVNVFGLAV